MRDLVILAAWAAMLPFAFTRPIIGVMLWVWSSFLSPNEYIFGFMAAVPFNKVVAAVTLLALLAGGVTRRFRADTHSLLLLALAVVATLSTLTAVSTSPVVAMLYEKLIKILVLCVILRWVVDDRLKMHAVLMAMILGMAFHGVLEGLKFLASGGAHVIVGVPTIGDNNHFALAILLVLPIVYFLYTQAAHKLARLALLGAGVIGVVSVVGTLSRGGLIGLVAVAGFFLMSSSRKVMNLLLLAALGGMLLLVAPDRWFNRMDTIETAKEDNSFMFRIVAWKISTLIAMDNPLLGGGFHAVQDVAVWRRYASDFHKLDFIATPEPDPELSVAAHSIYFQALGDLGLLGLSCFLSILAVAWFNAQFVKQRAGPDQGWMRELATMLQASLVAFTVSGAALSMAWFEPIYVIVTLLAALRAMVEESAAAPAVTLSRPTAAGRGRWGARNGGGPASPATTRHSR